MGNADSSQSFNTRMKLIDALDRLVATRDYERATVLDICEEAAVSRSTFYHYFQDKNALVQWHSEMIFRMGSDKIGRTLTWFQGHYVTSTLMNRHKNLYYRAGRVTDYENVRSHYVRRRIKVLRETVETWHHTSLTELLDFQIHAVAEMEASMADRVLRNEMLISDERYARLLSQCIPQPLFTITNTPVDPMDDSEALGIMLRLFDTPQ